MPVDFTNAYKELSKDADAIVSIHLPAPLSGTYNSALQGKELAEVKCPVEVVDSFSLSMGLGLVTMAAARVAQAGGSLSEVMEETRKAIDQVEIRGLLDTLTYLLKGGRITKARATVGSLLNIKPILKTVNGELIQAARARSFSKGMDILFEFAKDTPGLQEVAIVHSTVPEEANLLKERLSSIIGEKRIHMARLGAGLGVHGGPGTLLVAVKKS